MFSVTADTQVTQDACKGVAKVISALMGCKCTGLKLGRCERQLREDFLVSQSPAPLLLLPFQHYFATPSVCCSSAAPSHPSMYKNLHQGLSH